MAFRTFLCGLGLAFAVGANAADGNDVATVATASANPAHLEVEYADTLLGTQALFAVRACAAEDSDQGQLDVLAGKIREALTGTKDDVIVRVFDPRGREISRHVGAQDVCGYARISAAFVTSINRAHMGEKKQ